MDIVGQVSQPLKRPDKKQHQQVLANLPKITPGSASASPPKATATPCLKVTFDKHISVRDSLRKPAMPNYSSSPSELYANHVYAASSKTTLSPPTLQSCYPKNTTAPVGAIDAPTQSNFARTFCTKFNRTFNSTTPAVLWNALSATYKDQLSPYHYTVSWIPGCKTSVTQQSTSQPLGASNAAVNCVNLLTENFSRYKYRTISLCN